MSQSRIIRQRIWDRLKAVARPDTRFHLDFLSFIPDFDGADAATGRLLALPAFGAGLGFVTPDNSMHSLRTRLIAAGRPFVMSTYNIRRGFLYLDPAALPPGDAADMASLDALERHARPVTLTDLAALGPFAFLATGASAVSADGVRFGKGHTYFDLEWGMFSGLGLAGEQTPVAAVVHDVQLVEDRLHVSDTEIPVDLIATPSRLIRIARPRRRPRGIDWGLVTPDLLEDIPPLRELARMHGIA